MYRLYLPDVYDWLQVTAPTPITVTGMAPGAAAGTTPDTAPGVAPDTTSGTASDTIPADSEKELHGSTVPVQESIAGIQIACTDDNPDYQP